VYWDIRTREKERERERERMGAKKSQVRTYDKGKQGEKRAKEISDKSKNSLMGGVREGAEAEKGLLRYIWVLLNITRVWNPNWLFKTPFEPPYSRTTYHPPTPLNLVLADSSGRYGYYGIRWLMAFLRAFRQFSLFFFGTSFRPFQAKACRVNGLPERLRK
jgi:hypothetical protein